MQRIKVNIDDITCLHLILMLSMVVTSNLLSLLIILYVCVFKPSFAYITNLLIAINLLSVLVAFSP